MDNTVCKNNYKDEKEFSEKFFSTKEDSKKCNNCPNLKYEDGITICVKFNKHDIL